MSHIPPPSYPNAPNQYPTHGGPMPPAESNPMGVAGFVCSIIGLISCGLASPIAVILSVIGMQRKPKGFATAGAIIGGVGTMMFIVTTIMIINTIRTGREVMSNIGTQLERAGAQMVLNDAAQQIATVWEEDGTLPGQKRGDGMIASQRDPWGNSVLYEPSLGEDEDEDEGEDGDDFFDEGFLIRSMGEDELADTEDDILVGPFYDSKTALEQTRGFEEVFENIEAEMKKQAEEAKKDRAKIEEAGSDALGDSEADPILDFGDQR